MRSLLLIVMAGLLFSGCATSNGPTVQDTDYSAVIARAAAKESALPKNPKHGDNIWGLLTVGMPVKAVLDTLPKSKFDDQWNSAGMVGVMAEAGILASNKIKVTADIEGPFKSPSTLYVLFDEAGRLDGVVIATKKNDLPARITANYGTMGYYLPEYKDAAKQIIKYAIPELGKRTGAPKFGKESMDSVGSVGVASGVGGKNAVGMGFSLGSMSPASIFQMYERDGYRSMLSIRTIYMGTYNTYAAVVAFMAIQARPAGDDEIPDVE